MSLEKLLSTPTGELRTYGAQPEMDPLTEADALQEAQVLSVRFDPLRLTVGVLFDLRVALQLREANTGVLTASGVQNLSWSGPTRATDLTAWSIGSSTPRCDDGLFSLTLSMWPAPGARLAIVADGGAFFTCDVAGLGEAPPDYVGEVQQGLPNWGSKFTVVHAVFLDPAGDGGAE